MDPLSLVLGATATKWIFRVWIKDESLDGLSSEIVDLVRGRIGNVMEGRRASRQFEQLAERMAERIDPLIATEFRGTSSGERNAAALAANEAMERALSSSIDPVKVDLDAALLEREVRALSPNATDSAFLSDGGVGLFDLLLSECCSYVVATCARLPDFTSQAARELLARDTRLLELGAEILDRLPRTLPESWGQGSDDDVFTAKYRNAVVQKNDWLQIFGVTDRKIRKSYSLSVAYISLSATIPVGRVRSSAPGDSESDSKSDKSGGDTGAASEADEALRVEAALSGHPRLVLGGLAGSGKTTLIQWIAVTAAQGEFSGELADWNGDLPFILPLRRFTEEDFPAPEEFVRVSHKSLSGAMPTGWAHRVLAAGRAIVLIDGLDELPEERRDAARTWLNELISSFPDSRFVVTSRPLAISPEWETLPGFKYSELLPMQRSDIRAFVKHWHDAAEQLEESDEQKSAVRVAEKKMLAAVGDLPAIRTLCTSPLLCALICAMHRQNVNQLPESRMELYETALQMLVSSRDEEREVAVGPALSYVEKRALLSDFALWLHENGASDATEETYYSRIAKKLPQLPRRTDEEPTAVADLILTRSGVLRRPVEGRVDFVHRSFLEYLAAAELVEDEAVGKLLTHAHLDQWREVVVMAAGHFNVRKREELLRGLAELGQRNAHYRHRLYLLAVACIETSPVLSPEMQDLLAECLEEVVPPQNMRDAAAVASAGALAVPRLRKTKTLATTAAACVRALSMIGSDDALEALKTYGRDDRKTVIRQLMRAWGSFDGETFAKEVLGHSPLLDGHVTLKDAEYVPFLEYLTGAKTAYLDISGPSASVENFPASDVVTGVNLSLTTRLHDLRSLARYPNLRTCYVEYSRSLKSLKGLRNLAHLEVVYLDNNVNLADIDDLSAFSSLRRLDLAETAVESLDPIKDVHFGTLNLGGDGPTELPSDLHVKSLSISDGPMVQDFSWLERIRSTETLSIAGWFEANGIPSLTMPDSVTELRLLSFGARSVDLWVTGKGLSSLSSNSTILISTNLPALQRLETSAATVDRWVTSGLDVAGTYPKLRQIVVWGNFSSAPPAIPGFRMIGRSGTSARRVVFLRTDR